MKGGRSFDDGVTRWLEVDQALSAIFYVGLLQA